MGICGGAVAICDNIATYGKKPLEKPQGIGTDPDGGIAEHRTKRLRASIRIIVKF